MSYHFAVLILITVRALLFATAFVSMITFGREARPSWRVFCFWWATGKVRRGHLVSVAALGWTGIAFGAMVQTGYRLYQQLCCNHFSGVLTTQDAIWASSSFTVYAVSFYLPIMAMKLWRGLYLRLFLYTVSIWLVTLVTVLFVSLRG